MRTLERAFLRITTPFDRRQIKKAIGLAVTITAIFTELVNRLMMWRSIAKHLLVTGGALLALFLINILG